MIILRRFKYTFWTFLDYLTCNLTVHILSNFYLVHSAMKNMYYVMYYLLQLLLCLLCPFLTPPTHSSSTPNTHCKFLLISALFWVLIFLKKLLLNIKSMLHFFFCFKNCIDLDMFGQNSKKTSLKTGQKLTKTYSVQYTLAPKYLAEILVIWHVTHAVLTNF